MKAPNKSELLKQAKLRGFNTSNEVLILECIKVSNLIKRINTRASNNYVGIRNCKKLYRIIERFVNDTAKVLDPPKPKLYSTTPKS